jgi:hypothetical protein
MTTLGIIGAGSIGSQVARMAVKNGHDVVLSNSRGPETLAGLVAELGSHARAATPAEAAAAADIAVVSIPFSAYLDVPVEPLAGKVVIDTTNYFWERDGRYAELDEKSTTDSQLLQEHLSSSRVVKAFNHLRAAEISTDGTPAGTPSRRALGIAGDDAEAKAVVTSLYDEFGFDTVDVGSLADSWRLGRGSPAQVVRQTAEELRANAARARQQDRS